MTGVWTPDGIAPDQSVVVIGAGPVGLCASLALAQEGFDVTVVEARRGDVLDKACGEGLMPDAVTALAGLNVDLDGVGIPLRGIRYLDRHSRVEADFRSMMGRGIRRLELSIRLDRAVQCSRRIDVRRGTRARVIPERSGDPTERPGREAPARKGALWRVQLESGEGSEVLTPRWIVAADGMRSAVRSTMGLARPGGRGRFGARVHFAVEPWTDRVEVYWLGGGLEAYVTPVGGREVGLALLWAEREGKRPTFEQHLARVWQAFPRLGERLAAAPRSSTVRGAGPLRQPVRRVWRDNVALVGDASGYIDAITGEGMALGFCDARDLASALVTGDLARYARVHKHRRRLPHLLIHGALLMSRHPSLRHVTLRMMSRQPWIFERLLALHV